MPTFGTPSFGGTASGTSLTIPKPPGLVNGDVVLIAARSQEGSSANDWTLPSGFARLTAAPATLPSRPYRVASIWYKTVTNASAEPANYVLTGPSGRNVGTAVRYVPDATGAMTVVGTVPYGGTSVSSGVVTFGARTISAAPAISLILLAAECTAGISHVPTTLPAGYTVVANGQSTLDSSTSGSRTAIWLGYRSEPDTSIETVTGGYSGASASGGYEATIRGGLNVTIPLGQPVKLGDGSLAYMSYLDGAGVRKAPPSIRVTREPFLIADSMSTPGVTMGHRGASAATGMPEMSRRAYRYAATQRGYRMLEFSCNVTSDGVFVGVHDNNLNRTSETSGLASVNNMTWAQVQTYNNTLNSSGIPAPYYRLDAFLDEFAREETVHVDPKFNMAGASAFLDVLDAHAGPDRAALKYVGITAAASALSDAARARGYLTGAYVYGTDWAAGDIHQWQDHWDIIGMEWNASTDVWARTTTGTYPGIRSYGKPVLAHIIPNQGAYDTVKAKIEEGGWIDGTPGHTWIAQVSGVSSVAPVS